MNSAVLRRRSLSHYWRTNLAVVGGVAIAVAVLAGALMVGVSVRASLRDMVLQRLGQTDHVVLGEVFFREELSAAFGHAAPLIVAEGFVSAQESGRRAVARAGVCHRRPVLEVSWSRERGIAGA